MAKNIDHGKKIVTIGADLMQDLVKKHDMDEPEILTLIVFMNTLMIKTLYDGRRLEQARGLLDKQKSLILNKLSKDGWE